MKLKEQNQKLRELLTQDWMTHSDVDNLAKRYGQFAHPCIVRIAKEINYKGFGRRGVAEVE